MSTANKLSYLNDTKSLLRTSLNKFGSNILTTDTFRSYDTKLNDIYDKLPKVTATGQGMTIYDVQNGYLDDFKMIGVDLSQSGTPTSDNPQEIKVVEGRQVITDKGKNLFDKNNANYLNAYMGGTTGNIAESTEDKCIYISCKSNTTYTVKKIKDNTKNRFRIGFTNTIPAIGSTCNPHSGDQDTLTDYTLTSNSSNKYLVVYYFVTGGELTEQQILDSIQIEEGSTATDYEPYYEPVSYNIDLHGKNEFDGEYEDGYYNMNGTKPSTQDPYGRRSTNLNKIEPNTNYSISINNNIISETIRLFYYDASRKFISTESISNGTFTSPAECYYVSWHSTALKQNYPDGLPNMMIEQGQTVTTYEDYYDYKLAKMPNTSYKNKIYKNNGNWYFEKNIEKINSYNDEIINTEYMSTTGQLSIGATIYYVLVNLVTTQITNATLINQLEAISVHTGTNIITISNSNNIIPEIEITRLKELEKLV